MFRFKEFAKVHQNQAERQNDLNQNFVLTLD